MSVVTTAFTAGFSRSILAVNASSSSRLESERDRMASASRVADQSVGSSGTGWSSLWARKLAGDLNLRCDHDWVLEGKRHRTNDHHPAEWPSGGPVRDKCTVTREESPGAADPDPGERILDARGASGGAGHLISAGAVSPDFVCRRGR